MNTELFLCLKKIIRENGTDAFDNIKLVGSVLAKNAAAKAHPECDVLMLCLMADYHKELIGADKALRDSVKKTIAERLHNNEGLDAGLCNSTLDILEAALFGNEPVMEESPVEADTPSSTQEKRESADAEIEKLQAIIAEHKEQNARLAEEITHITKQKGQSSDKASVLEKSIKKTKHNFIAAPPFLVISVIITFVVYNTMNEKNKSLANKNVMQRNEIITLKERYENSKSIWAINVTDMEFGNANQYDQWITKPGVALKASEVQFLNPVFIYDSPASSFLTFYIKIKDSAGTVIHGEKSPEGFSYSRQQQIKRGTSLRFDPGGFGTARGGFYSSGVWTIELWGEGLCLYSREVKLE
ncbi:MAG: hypothetical protein LBB61_08410 [Treponema sp.]|jgi:hypothetical protein|nr:hypothetical protein [Treponema sp.]